MHDLRQEDGLLAAVQQGRAALFLGAGASRGALSSQTGVAIPEAADLAREIARKFLGSDYEQYDLKAVCDLVASDRGIPTVQEYIHTRLDPFQPADSHRLLPTFVWGGLLTTNYDLMIERAYAECPNSLQTLSSFPKTMSSP